MSKVSRRANREEIKTQRKALKKTEKVLRKENKANGVNVSSHATISNHKCAYESVEEESIVRNEAIAGQMRIFRSKLPILLKRLSKIKDPRNPKKTKHKIATLMIYGILTFIFHISSGREVNREMTRPMFWKNLIFFFPELESLPHYDTLKRLLSEIDVNEIESIHVELVRGMIRNKKFLRYLINNCYPISIDGTQKFCRKQLWAEECQQRKINKKDESELQYYVYILEANLTFYDGMTIPLMSEFLSYTEGDTDNNKQDCELKAFYRLAKRLKSQFPSLKIMILLDGLYAKGPVIEICRANKWEFMIVLKDDALPSVMSEFNVLSELEEDNTSSYVWGGRKQQFKWVNKIEYYFGPNEKKMQRLHVVECREKWKEVDKKSGEIVENNSRHVWISSNSLNRRNLHERCNLGARHRWGIEVSMLVEKHHGYQYEHCFSYNWNAMKGIHYLMRLGHMLNVLGRYSQRLVKIIKDTGVRGFIRLIRETMASPWPDYEWLKKELSTPFQLRLV